MDTLLRQLVARIRAVFRHDADDHEFAEEMAAHLALAEERLTQRGMTPEEARRVARIEFGGVTQLREAHRRTRGIPMLETLQRDVRGAVRGLLAAPGFTAVVLAVLTLAMGATTAVFSVVDAVTLRGLPFDDADRIVSIHRLESGQRVTAAFSAPDYLELCAQQDVFSSLAAVATDDVPLRREGMLAPEALRGQRVTAEFFGVLRVSPAMGRPFTVEEEVEGRSQVAVISDSLWRRRFGGAADVLGKRLPSTAGDIEIIGVMPAHFGYPVGTIDPTDLWRPYVIPAEERVERIRSYLDLIARLGDDISLGAAETRLSEVAASAAASNVPGGLTWQPVLRTLRSSLVDDTRSWMLMLLGAVTCVLLIACVNIANLLLVRASVRARELAVRTALGATHWDLGRMLLVESLVLSTAGGTLGLLVAWWGIDAMQSLLPSYLPRVANIALDWRVVGVAAGSAFVTGIGFGLAPVLQALRTTESALRESGRTDTTSRRRQRLRTTLLVTQVALAVVLVTGAALFLTSFSRLMRVDLGLDYRHVLLVDIRSNQPSSARLTNLLDRMRAVAGVQMAALATTNLPFSYSRTTNTYNVGQSHVSHDYFRALGVPLRAGRFFNAADSRGEPVVILNEAAATRYFPDGDPIGRRTPGARVVIGIVGNVSARGPEGRVEPDEFHPAGEDTLRRATLVLKLDDEAPTVAVQVMAAVRAEFPDVIIPAPQTLEKALEGYIAQRRFNMLLLSLFGVLGLTIAGVGIFGVMAFIVTQRTREIGIRMALGARALDVIWSVLRRASLQMGAGLVVGLALSLLLATSAEKFLFKVAPHDPWLYGAVCVVIALTALVAAYAPARRAARVDPLTSLRLE